MASRLVITCLSPSSVSVGDLGVHLAGRGSTATVLESTAVASRDLKDRVAARLVSVSRAPSLKVWPVARPARPPQALASPPEPAPSSVPVHDRPTPVVEARRPEPSEGSEVVKFLSEINDKLGELLRRPSAPPPEVVAAHVRAIATLPSVPDGLPGAPHPTFIPSTILPSDPSAGQDIKVKHSESAVGVDDSVSALKKLRKRT